MNPQLNAYRREWTSEVVGGWNRFWFTPSDPATLCLLRVLTGAMLFYTHLAWTKDLLGFFGPQGRLPVSFVREFNGSNWAWSYLYDIQSPGLLWSLHIAALVILAMFTLGLFTRVTAVLAWVIAISYTHRAAGALFGLDQINGFLIMYLMIAPCGAMYSLDRWWADRRAAGQEGAKSRRTIRERPLWQLPFSAPSTHPSTAANIAIRLVQIHMCVVYFFAGAGKLQGMSWWAGDAMWLSLANYEYQTLDMTWLAVHPLIINFLTGLTVAWELSYAALIWPRLTRPIMLALAVPLHLGIALCMGMITFGLIMLVGNLAFVPPTMVRPLLSRKWLNRAATPEPAG